MWVVIIQFIDLKLFYYYRAQRFNKLNIKMLFVKRLNLLNWKLGMVIKNVNVSKHLFHHKGLMYKLREWLQSRNKYKKRARYVLHETRFTMK